MTLPELGEMLGLPPIEPITPVMDPVASFSALTETLIVRARRDMGEARWEQLQNEWRNA